MNPQQKTSLLLLALLGTIAFPLAGMLQGRHAAAIKAWAQPALAQEAPQPEPTFTPPATLATGTTLNIDGSTNMRVINQALAQGFEERYPGSDVVLSSNGVEAALQALLQGNLNLAAVGRPLSDQERSQGLTQVPISREKIAIIVGRDNSFQGDLSFDQFAQIFRGEITNWAQLKGPNLPIRFIDRPAGSDTRQALSGYEIFEGAPFETGANAITLETDDTAAVVRELGRDGISYAISSQVLDQDNVRVLTMDGTLPDDSRYPYSQPRGYVYRGEPSLAVEAFLGYATNPNGQQAVAEAKADEAATVATADLLPGQLAVSPDGQTIVRGTQDGLLEWYDDQGNSQGITVPAHTSLVTGIAFAPDGQSLLSSGADGSLRRWDLQGNPLGAPLQEDGDPITALAFSPNGQRIASGSNNGSVQLWSADGLPQGEPIQAHQGAVRGVAFSADSQTLITGSTDGAVRLWNPDGTPAGEVANVSASGITTLAASPNGQFLASGGADGTLQLFNAAGAPQGDSIAAHTDAITALAISPDGQTIASAGRDNTLRLWDPSGNAKTAADSTLPSPASALAYKPDGELVTGFADSTLQLRDPQGRLRIGELPGLPEDSNLNLPPGIANALQALPRSTWWIIPAIPILLILIGLLWSLFSGRKASVDDDLEDDFEESTPAADSSTAINGAPAVVTGAPIDGSYPPAGEVPPESAWVAAAPAADSGSSLGDKLGQAKVDLAEGTRLFREGRYDEALNRFNNSIEGAEVERMKAIAAGASLGGITLVLAPATARRGSVLALLGRPDRALESFNRALEMDPNSVEAWTGKGRLLASTGQLDEALFCFDKALELDATNGSAWAAKGQALLQMGRQQEGQDCLSRAAELGADELAPVTPPDLTVSPAGDIPEGYVPEGFAPEEYRNEYGVEYVPPVRDIPEGYVPEGFAPEAYPENERLRESMPSGDAPLPGPVSEAAPPALSGGVPTELSQLAAGLPSTETVTHSGTVLAEPEVPAHMQQVVEDLPDDPEMPEHAFITSAQITNPDDLD
ncbi:MAG TPA: substrate-binding domain-containing protein, partial [Trichocoleus sp.]